MGQGSFTHVCPINGDPVCSETGEIDDFKANSDLGDDDGTPAAVAVGSTFGVVYAGTVRQSGDKLLVVVSAASPIDKLSSGTFRLEQPAESAFIARDNQDRVVDFLVVEAAEAVELSVWQEQEIVSDITVGRFLSSQLTVTPVDKEGAPPRGSPAL